jgi:hypothetical protein
MARTARLDNIVNGQAWALLAISLLFCALCVSLNSAYPGLSSPALACLAFAGGFLVSMAMISGFKTFRWL